MRGTEIDFEIEAVRAGLKPACLKEGLPKDDGRALLTHLRASGLFAELVHLHGRDDVGGHQDGDDLATLAIAKEPWILEEVVRLQRAHRLGARATPIADVGALMGYPACCVSAFAMHQASSDLGDNLANEKLPFRRSPSSPLSPLLHRVGRARVISHHLCKPDCAPSIELARRTIALAPDARSLERILQRPVLFLSYELRAELVGHWDSDRFLIDQLEPILDSFGETSGFPIVALTASALRLDRGGVTFMGLRDEPQLRMKAREPLLTVPGEPIADAALDAIGGPMITGPVRPELPSTIHPGVRVGSMVISAITPHENGHRLMLRGPSGELAIVVRAPRDGRQYVVRRGRWAIELDDRDRESLDETRRDAIAIILRALPP